MVAEGTFFPIFIFAILIAVSFLVPEVIRKAKIMIVPAYIVGGIILGPTFLGIEPDQTFLTFLANIGIYFLVFEAGMEIHEYPNLSFRRSMSLSVISSLCSFSLGFFLMFTLGYGLLPSLLVGTVMLSASVGEIIPMIKSSLYLRERFASFLIPAIVILDAITLFFVSCLIQWEKGMFGFVIFLIATPLIILFILILLPKLASLFFTRETQKQREADFKFMVFTLLTIIALGELLGIHGILIAFLVGMSVGQHIPNEQVYHKLQGVAHGFFIPMFFIILGIKMDISVFYKGGYEVILITIMLLVVLILARLVGAILFSGTTNKFVSKDGLVIGALLLPKVSAAIATATLGFDNGIIGEDLFNSIIMLTIITAIGAPILVRSFHFERKERAILFDHTVIIGYGRTSAKLTHVLDHFNRDIAVIDRDMSKVDYLCRHGIKAYLGNGVESDVLECADVKHAKAVIVTIPDEHELYLSVKIVKELNPESYVIVKVHTFDLLKRLETENLIDYYIWPEKLGSQKIIAHMMKEKELIF